MGSWNGDKTTANELDSTHMYITHAEKASDDNYNDEDVDRLPPWGRIW